MTVHRKIMVPTRDGALLATALFLPEGSGPWPCLLKRTPYGRGSFADDALYAHYPEWVARGYAVAAQDCRGTGDSTGRMRLNGQNEHEDGYDAVEWLAGQSWCNGSVGMFGLSYDGFTQLAAAAQAPPHLKAITPFMTLSQEPFGASGMQTLNGGHIFWAYAQTLEHPETYIPDADCRGETLARMRELLPQLQQLGLTRPADRNPAALVPGVSLLEDYLCLVRGMEVPSFWTTLHCPLDMKDVSAASLHCTGWLDIACDATIRNFHAMERQASGENENYLLIGPWTHGGMMPAEVDDVDFGEDNSGEAQQVHMAMLRLFDRALKDGLEPCLEEKVRYFVTGTNTWRMASQWPPQGQEVRLYLTADGELSRRRPVSGERTLLSDPENPVPSSFADSRGHGVIPDWAEIETREDVLSFRTEPLEQAVTLAGEARVRLQIVPDSPDADLVCRLLDCAPDGRMRKLCSGLIRLRHRNGLFHNDLLESGKLYTVEVFAGNFANCFLPGHRIVLQLCGSAYPEHDPNPHAEGPALLTDRRRIAHTGIRLGGDCAGYLSMVMV